MATTVNAPAPRLVQIGLCVNDTAGNCTGRLLAIDIPDCGLELESAGYPTHGSRYRVVYRAVKVGRREFAITNLQNHVGNLCWDQVTMEYGLACLFLLELRGVQHFRAITGRLEPGFDELLRAAGGVDLVNRLLAAART